ncbi:spike base protein, RCAP_Rcc01079 family [Bradyrhizobium sp. AZCC 1708]|uniref:spike base protein, RCAP_Rcc01079 family n=1 Tax=Bradyrhizobium sp. AZCC 1708 TaxID=3117015 RepID=UPI003FA584E5
MKLKLRQRPSGETGEGDGRRQPAITSLAWNGRSRLTPSNFTGTGVLFSTVPVGWFPVQVRRVNATGTTATNIVAVYD